MNKSIFVALGCALMLLSFQNCAKISNGSASASLASSSSTDHSLAYNGEGFGGDAFGMEFIEMGSKSCGRANAAIRFSTPTHAYLIAESCMEINPQPIPLSELALVPDRSFVTYQGRVFRNSVLVP